MSAGRPKAYNGEQVAEIVEKLTEYIATTTIPIVAEFAYQNDIPRHALYDYDEFSTLLKKMIDKKESNLERMCLNKEIERTMAIFSLKQLGWKDKQEVEHSGGLHNTNTELTPEERKAEIDELIRKRERRS